MMASIPFMAPSAASLQFNVSWTNEMAALGNNVPLTWKTIMRFFYDPRKYKSVSREYWKIRGGAGDMSLHHWLFPQRATWVPEGLRNAGFNLMELPRGFNSWMGYSTTYGRTAEWGLRVGAPAGSAYLGSEIGNYLYENLGSDNYPSTDSHQ